MAAESIVSDVMRAFLRLIGVWPGCSYRILKRTTLMMILLTFMTSEYWYLVIHIKTIPMADLLDKLSVTLSNTLVFVKFTAICINYRVLTETLAIMAEDWNDLGQLEKRIMLEKAALSDRITKITLILFVPSSPLYAATIFLSSRNDPGKTVLMGMEFPFNSTVSPMYEIVLGSQMIGESIFATIAGMFMAFTATLVIHVAALIEVITARLEEDLDRRNEQQARLRSMRNIIVTHQRVIGLSENIEIIFRMIALVQFLLDITVMCFIGFMLVTSLDTGQFFTMLSKTFAYYVSINFEALILCYTGEYLTVKGEHVGQVAYNRNWYDLSINETRTLLLLILRSQKPLTLTIGKFGTLSLVTYANMIKASVSYVSVLYAME